MSVTSVETTPITTTIDQPAQKVGLRPRRTLNRLALALAGIAAAILGQIFFSRQLLGDGLLCYAIAVILFNLALAKRFFSGPSTPPLSPWPNANYSLAAQNGWRLNVGVWLIFLAVGVSFFAFNFFGNEAALIQAWWVYLSSLVLLVGGGLVLNQTGSWARYRQYLLPNRYIAIGLGVVIGLALFMRLYNLQHQPFGIWFDEAEAGLQARQMLQEPGYRPIFYFRINVTGHLLAAYAMALHWLGDTIESMRLVSVLFGLGGVLAAYLFGRELRGPRFGLALAFFIAVAHWHVNFSRIAMTGIDTPFFEFASLYFLVRLLRRGRLLDALWAGLMVGFGLVFYTAFRLYVLALLVFAITATIVWVIGRFRPTPLRRLQWGWLATPNQSRAGWPHLARLSLLLVAVWLVTMPVVKFALDNPEAFQYRTQEISIFTRRDQPDLKQALWANTAKHLLMFNFHGDNNGRHNLPGEPMLDPAMGILAVLGLGLALTRPHYPANAFFLLLLPTALLGGIFSVDFEAPQSLRTIAAIPAVFYFATLALAALGREAEKALKPLPRIWLFGPAAALAGFMLIYNAYLYFDRQANDFASWNAFSTPETIIGYKMAQLGPDYVYFLSPLLTSHPTTQFLAPNITYQQSLQLSDALPVRVPPGRPVALFIHPDDVEIFEEAKQLYPNAKFEAILGRAEEGAGPPIVYFANLQPADLVAVQGLELHYRPNQPGDQPLNEHPATPPKRPPHYSRTFTINLTWPDDRPPQIGQAGIMAGDYIAEWNGILYVPLYGPYSFRLVTPGPGWLEIDGNLIFDGQQPGQLTGLPLAQGNHTLRVQARVTPGQVALYWQPPGWREELVPPWALYQPFVTNHGLQGSYYPNDRWEGQPAIQRIDSSLDTYFHLPPLNRPYTVEWLGALDVPYSGVYRLGLRAVGQARLFLDGQLLVATTSPDQTIDAPMALEAGLHDIRVLFKDNTDRSRIHLYWMPPQGQFEPIPSQNLWPPLGRYPNRPAPLSTGPVLPLELNWLASLGGPGAEPGQFFEPRDVAVLAGGNLAVADTVNRRVQILTPQGHPVDILTGDDLPFEEPLALATNSHNQLLILDSTRQWVYRYDLAGHFVERFGGPTAYLFHPRGLTVFADDSLALADTGSGRLALFSADGAQAGSIGGPGSGPGQFNEPTDVLRTPQGTYFVAEAMSNRIQQVDARGNPLGQWNIPAAYALNGPHMAFGPDGSIFVTESQSRSLYRYTPDGKLLNQWESIGPVTFAAPVGIYFEAETNQLYVTDIWTHQVHIFEVKIQS